MVMDGKREEGGDGGEGEALVAALVAGTDLLALAEAEDGADSLASRLSIRYEEGGVLLELAGWYRMRVSREAWRRIREAAPAARAVIEAGERPRVREWGLYDARAAARAL